MAREEPLIYAPAKRRGIGLLIMLTGSWGSGKTKSALRLATGLANGGTIGACDTEHGRMLAYADDFEFQHLELKEPFEPHRFEDAAVVSQRAKHAVWICDSFSHEHVGPGGVLDMFEANLTTMTRGDFSKREQLKYTAWIKPKGEHKALLQRLWQLNQHIILCTHAEKKLDLVMDRAGKMVPNKDAPPSPVCAPDLPYAMTCAFALDRAKPGVPVWLKAFDKLEPLIDFSAPIDEDLGRRLGAWARGENPPGLAKRTPPATRPAQQQAPKTEQPPPIAWHQGSAGDGWMGEEPPPFEPPPDGDVVHGLPQTQDGLPLGQTDDEPPAKPRSAKAALEQLVAAFKGVQVRADHFLIVDKKVNRDRIAWLKTKRPDLHAALEVEMKAAWARTAPQPETAG